MKLVQLINMHGVLVSLKDERLPFKVNYAIARNIAILDPVVAAFNTTKNDMIQQFGIPTDIPGQMTVSPENMQSYADGINPILDAEEEVNLYKIQMELMDTTTLTPAIIANLLPMLIEPTE